MKLAGDVELNPGPPKVRAIFGNGTTIREMRKKTRWIGPAQKDVNSLGFASLSQGRVWFIGNILQKVNRVSETSCFCLNVRHMIQPDVLDRRARNLKIQYLETVFDVFTPQKALVSVSLHVTRASTYRVRLMYGSLREDVDPVKTFEEIYKVITQTLSN